MAGMLMFHLVALVTNRGRASLVVILRFFKAASLWWVEEIGSGVYPHNWDFGFRRHLTVGEIDEVTRLLVTLDGVRLIPSRRDNRCKLDRSGLYSCHSFCSFILPMVLQRSSLLILKFGRLRTPQRLKFFYGRLPLEK
ncbi:unnamed protein product [Prunus armeniaca]